MNLRFSTVILMFEVIVLVAFATLFFRDAQACDASCIPAIAIVAHETPQSSLD